jgi:hypothetical protein
MRAVAMVLAVVVAVGGPGCFSTARYDDAHVQRVATINARYEAENRRLAEQYASLRIGLDQRRAQALPSQPGAPPLEPRADPRAGEREAVPAFHQDALRSIDEQARLLAERQAQARARLDADRQGEIQVSDQQRCVEIASGRAVRRARLQAAAQAVTALAQGPISARQPCVGATGAQLLSRVGECRAGPWVPGRRSSSSHPRSPGSAAASPARR